MARLRSRKYMVRKLADHQSPSEHWLSTSQLPRKTREESISLDQKHRKRIFLGYVLLASGGWSSGLMIKVYEDLQGSEAAEIYVKRFKNQEIFVKEDYEFPCASSKTIIDGGRGNFEREDDVEKSKKATKRE